MSAIIASAVWASTADARRWNQWGAPGPLACFIYREETNEEECFCNCELNRAFRGPLEAAGLRVTGQGEAGEVRGVELPTPRDAVLGAQLPSAAERSQPVITALPALSPGPPSLPLKWTP